METTIEDTGKLQNVDSVCFISQISNLEPIEGADKIELAKVEGWFSIVQKGIHKVGDKVICISTDAVIPQRHAEAWGVAQYLRKGNRVRTIKLKGKYSECILIPLFDLYLPSSDYKLGEDLMGELEITKYEPPTKEERVVNGKKVRVDINPNFHIFYKFPNQKNVVNMFKDGDECVITRKMHGTNSRYGIVKRVKFTLWQKIKKFFGALNKWDYYEYVYGSHNVQKLGNSTGYYSTDVYKEIAEKYNIEEALWKEFKARNDTYNKVDNLIIYGEIIGPGVQGEHYDYGLTERAFVGFNVEKDGEYLNDFLTKSLFTLLGLQMVPVIYVGPWSKALQDQLVLNQNFKDSKGNVVPHEGVVVADPSGNRTKVCKVINPDYTIFSEKKNIPDSH